MFISCSKQMRAWADHLHNFEIKGERHLRQSRRESDRKKCTVAFSEELLNRLPSAHPLRVTKEGTACPKSQS